jgi:transposase
MNPADLQLPDDVDALKAMIIALAGKAARADALEADIAVLRATNATADERIARLTSILKMLERAWYGKRSERLGVAALDGEQYAFVFEQIESGLAELEASLEKARGASGAKRTPRSRKGCAPHLERIEQVIEPEDPPGREGQEKLLIGEDVSERLCSMALSSDRSATKRVSLAFSS